MEKENDAYDIDELNIPFLVLLWRAFDCFDDTVRE